MNIRVDVSKEAQDQVRELIRSQQSGTAVRVFLEEGGGGGCGCGSGGCGSAEGGNAGGGGRARFAMAFDTPRKDDQVIPVDGFSILVDGPSAEMLDGASIDFVQSLDATGFKISAPKLSAEGGSSSPEESGRDAGGCGCGSGGCGCG